MPSDYSLSDVLERLFENQQALEAAIMELTLLIEEQGAQEVGGNVRGALWTMGENAPGSIEEIGNRLIDCTPRARRRSCRGEFG
jgi:hypothetical protein